MEDKITTTMYEKEEKTFPVWPCVTQERRYIGRKMAITTIIVNGKIICRKMAKKNVVFPTYFLWVN
jgi:hypothetical protein